MKGFFPLSAKITITDGPRSGQSCRICINSDRSIYVEDWTFVQYWYDNHVTAFSDEFAILTLLLASRGQLQEKTLKASEELAIAAAVMIEAIAADTSDEPVKFAIPKGQLN